MIDLPPVLDLITAGEAFDDFVFHGLARLPRAGEEIKTDRLARSPGGGAVIALARPGTTDDIVSAWRALGRNAFRVQAGAPATPHGEP